MSRALLAATLAGALAIWGRSASAEAETGTLRIATFNPELRRAGPGLLLRDILAGDDPQVLTARDLILQVRPDILLLTRFDYDLELRALRAFEALLRAGGPGFDHLFALRPNTGMPTGLDLDGDGRTGGPADAQGFGDFSGQGGMAILSRYPIAAGKARDFSAMLWKDLPGATLPEALPGADPEALGAVLRLSSVAHWDVPILAGCGPPLRLLAYHATTPAFDGPEDRNGLRNRDENLFWLRYLDGALPWTPPDGPFVLLGDANLDPADGDGRREAIRALLDDPRLQDPAPRSARGTRAARLQGGANMAHRGDPALDTADWRDDPGPGNLRVDYVLPSAGLEIVDSGLAWADAGREPSAGEGPPLLRHALVWVDILWEAGSECVD